MWEVHLALAQIIAVVGDIQGNTLKILDAIARAEQRQATTTLLPELAITGYPPEDLLAREHFIDDNLAAVCGNARILPA